MNRTTLWYVPLMVLLSPKCELFEDQQIRTARVIEIRLDQSGSYRLTLDEAKTAALALVDNSRSDDVLRIGAINDRSFSSPTKMFTIPRSRAFDKKSRERQDAVKEEIKKYISTIVDEKSNRTDLWGMLSSASLFFKKFPDREKHLVIFSDMVDTEGLAQGDIDLEHVSVDVMCFPKPRSIAKYKQRIGFWKEALDNSGAKSFEVYGSDETQLTINKTIQ